jgi:DNA-directed RNA polymerase specialized sigma24 family protein
MADTVDITELLDAAHGGDSAAMGQVLSKLYHELHAMARRQLAGQQGQTLDATALVHEAYLKLIGRREAQFEDRAHFFAYAASAMRSVVVDYARQRLAQVVELRYFAGLSELEIASLLKRSERSIRRDWQKARMFLLASLQER